LEEGPVRKTPALLSALAVAAVVVTSLVGCSSSASADCTPTYASGSASKIVKATATSASFPTPLVAKTPQVSVSKAGKGSPVQNGDQVDYTYNVYDGKTGDNILAQTDPLRGGAVTTAKSTSITQALICAASGERLTLVSTLKQAFGKGAGGAQFPDSLTLVVVIDVKDHFLGKANGINQLPKDGMPNVITAVNGQPGIVIQELDKPKTLSLSTIKAGSGPVVKKGSTVHVKYTGWTWPSASGDKPTVWPSPGQDSNGAPLPDGEGTWTLDRAADLTVSSTSLPPGLYKALLGAKVGSQVLAVIPPKDGFGSSSANIGVTDKDTIIMVIDVLGIA
jgi:peptidylprolyl isomerase